MSSGHLNSGLHSRTTTTLTRGASPQPDSYPFKQSHWTLFFFLYKVKTIYCCHENSVRKHAWGGKHHTGGSTLLWLSLLFSTKSLRQSSYRVVPEKPLHTESGGVPGGNDLDLCPWEEEKSTQEPSVDCRQPVVRKLCRGWTTPLSSVHSLSGRSESSKSWGRGRVASL